MIRNLYWAALSRPPSREELTDLLDALGPTPSRTASGEIPDAERDALVDLALGILTSKEFLFNH